MCEASSPSEFDVAHGRPRPCRHCGFAWRYHRAADSLCPGTHPDGSLWQGTWESDGAKGTRYEASPRVEPGSAAGSGVSELRPGVGGDFGGASDG